MLVFVQVVHDTDVFGLRVLVEVDSTGEIACNFPIETDSSVQQIDKDCLFTGHDQITQIPTLTHFKAQFSSNLAAEEFKLNFIEVRKIKFIFLIGCTHVLCSTANTYVFSCLTFFYKILRC